MQYTTPHLDDNERRHRRLQRFRNVFVSPPYDEPRCRDENSDPQVCTDYNVHHHCTTEDEALTFNIMDKNTLPHDVDFVTPVRRLRRTTTQKSRCVIYAHELVDPPIISLFGMSPSRIHVPLMIATRPKVWQRNITELPMHALVAFLDDRSCCNALLVSHAWKSSLDHDAVMWKTIYRRRASSCVNIGARSYAYSWRALVQAGKRLSVLKLLRLKHDYIAFDFTATMDRVNASDAFEVSRVNVMMGQPRAPIVACLELLPNFFWAVLQTSSGFIHSGIVMHHSTKTPIIERGLSVAVRYLQELNINTISVYVIVLLLSTLHALPPSITPNAMYDDTRNSVRLCPFRLDLHLKRPRREPMIVRRFFNRPIAHHLLHLQHNISTLQTVSSQHASQSFKFADENASPFTPSFVRCDGVATLTADESGKLGWSFTKRNNGMALRTLYGSELGFG